jgi:hypothetical protein
MLFNTQLLKKTKRNQLPAGVVWLVIIISLRFGAEELPLMTAVEKIWLLLERMCLFWNLK